jgi:hypothetical protein
VVDVACQSDFPSMNSTDASDVKSVKDIVDNANSINTIIRPSEENQAAYDFFFILTVASTGKRFVQVIEPTISAGGPDPKEYFIKRYVNKLKKAGCAVRGQENVDSG